ncbi:radical SAM protein [Streptacidiphilus sp. EB129]|uniref:radical SAM protein n=1 Tax=Streptacidiphilus sp. EB129 TaxID=3156262 RepID=UPI0035132ED1
MPDVDLDAPSTALHNFAQLRGQLRVSLTPRCNINCWFCHNEGDVPPPATRGSSTIRPRERALDAGDYLTLIAALMTAGLKRVYFTGGEPLTSPLARPILENLPAPAADESYTLITNGTRIRTHRAWLARSPLDKVKVSLHYLSDETLHTIAGTSIGIATVLGGIDVAREIFGQVELNCLLQQENAHEVRAILDYALERRLPVQFIELVGTDFNDSKASSALPATDIITHLRTLTRDERIEVAGVGQGRRVFRIDGIEVDVLQRGLGRHHVGQCGTCPVRAKCVEGFWALRTDHSGGLQPCLLRDDLRLHLIPLLDNPQALAAAVGQHVAAFTEGTL